MLRRVIAWVLIAAFILLIVNITVIQYQINLSIGIYAAIIVVYLVTKPREKYK